MRHAVETVIEDGYVATCCYQGYMCLVVILVNVLALEGIPESAIVQTLRWSMFQPCAEGPVSRLLHLCMCNSCPAVVVDLRVVQIVWQYRMVG